MRSIKVESIQECVRDLVVDAAINLRPDVLAALQSALKKERDTRARNTFSIIIENAKRAHANKIPICQDTGMTVVFCEIGRDVVLKGDIDRAITKGVAIGTEKGCLRRSVVSDPILRINTGTNTPVLIHHSFCSGSKIKISLLLKGFGCENKGSVVMLNPTATLEEIEETISAVIVKAGANACPPFIVGVGIGGTMDKACELAKKALFEPVGKDVHEKAWMKKIARNVKKKVNASHIGPLGFGGKTTLLDLKIKDFPTHIAGLPVAVNISCHALRSKTVII